jgi:dynein intermediate chain
MLDLREPAQLEVDGVLENVWVDQVTVSSLDFPTNETITFWIGTEAGDVHQAELYTHDDVRVGLDPRRAVYRAHSAAVTRVEFHPGSEGMGFGDLFLTSSMDRTVKLWKRRGVGDAFCRDGGDGKGGIGGAEFKGETVSRSPRAAEKGAESPTGGEGADPMDVAPIYSSGEGKDCVYDVRWHPVHPALFARVDGSNTFDLYNLNVDTQVSFLCSFAPLL